MQTFPFYYVFLSTYYTQLHSTIAFFHLVSFGWISSNTYMYGMYVGWRFFTLKLVNKSRIQELTGDHLICYLYLEQEWFLSAKIDANLAILLLFSERIKTMIRIGTSNPSGIFSSTQSMVNWDCHRQMSMRSWHIFVWHLGAVSCILSFPFGATEGKHISCMKPFLHGAGRILMFLARGLGGRVTE